jgi:hypothetical protein
MLGGQHRNDEKLGDWSRQCLLQFLFAQPHSYPLECGGLWLSDLMRFAFISQCQSTIQCGGRCQMV